MYSDRVYVGNIDENKHVREVSMDLMGAQEGRMWQGVGKGHSSEVGRSSK